MAPYLRKQPSSSAAPPSTGLDGSEQHVRVLRGRGHLSVVVQLAYSGFGVALAEPRGVNYLQSSFLSRSRQPRPKPKAGECISCGAVYLFSLSNIPIKVTP